MTLHWPLILPWLTLLAIGVLGTLGWAVQLWIEHRTERREARSRALTGIDVSEEYDLRVEGNHMATQGHVGSPQGGEDDG